MPFPKPLQASIIYQDAQVYACLAMRPITKGHTVVVWKRSVRDLHLLSCEEYEHLMHVVDAVRDALQQELRVAKVYLIYMDEARHVHWHLVPRYNEQGFNVFAHAPKRVRTFPLATKLRKRLSRVIPRHEEFYGGTE